MNIKKQQTNKKKTTTFVWSYESIPFQLIAVNIFSRAMRKRVRAYADSEGPDQLAHPRSLIRAFAVRKQIHRIL